MAGRTVTGLDIGSVSIRAVETHRGKSGTRITNYGKVPLPAGAVVGGVITDDSAVITTLRQLWSTMRFRNRDVVLGVTNRQIVVREMAVANVPDRELRKTLPFQVRHLLPLPVEQSLLDFHPLEVPGDDAKTVRGLLIAAPKAAVLTAVRTTERAGLRVAKVDLASFALLRAASRLDDHVEAIADIGAQSTTVVAHHDGEPLIVRTIPRGGAEITEAIAARLGVPTEEAEALKCEVGLLPSGRTDTVDAVRDAVRPIIGEIRSSFIYLTSGDQQSRVTRLSLSGGGALLPGFDVALHDELGVEVVISDPLARLRGAGVVVGVNGDLERERNSAAVALGLTLGAS
jgi:type IV pilus assembly protein PilM